MRLLEDAGIIAGATILPDRWGRSGIRFGLQEMTRRGMTSADAPAIAAWINDLLSGHRTPQACRPEIQEMAVQEGMLTLRMDGIKKIEKGVTTLEEVVKETAG